MRYPLAQPIYLSTTLTNRTGVLTDDATLALKVQKPDLTVQNYVSPTHDGTGLYHQDIPAGDIVQIGHYQYQWTSSGVAAGVAIGEFEVFDPFEPTVISLQDAKLTVNINQATTTYDTELMAYVATATAMLEVLTGGPAYNRSVSEHTRVAGDLRTITLRQRPLVSVTSITDVATGSVMPITDLDPDPNSRVLRRKLGLPFWSRGLFYQVVYIAGWGTAIPPAFNTAARLIVNRLWQTARGPGQQPIPGEDITFLPGMAYGIPQRALEMMMPYTAEEHY